MLNAVTPEFAESLHKAVPPDRFDEAGPSYLEEPRGRYAGQAGLLVKTRSTNEVAALVKAANTARVPIVPYGGGTGLVGGQVAPDGPTPLILSLEHMRALRAVYPEENVVIAEAGMILADLQVAAQEANRLFPMSLASEGSARLGGILATNAGGVNVLRYGNTRDLCLGLEVVLPDGSIWNGLSRLRKNNTGYDLRHLMIGAEGTLGIITAAAMRLMPQPTGRGAAFLQVPSPDAAVALLAFASERLGASISALELIHAQSYAFLAETLPDIRLPFDTAPEWSVLIDIGTNGTTDPQEALLDLAEAAAEAGLITDGVVAQSQAQRAQFWSVREHIPEANRRIGAVSSHDISVPLGEISKFITKGKAAIAEIGPFRVNCFGHVGDGNLHFNVFPDASKSRADYEGDRPAIKGAVHDLVHALGGSVSAEHGVGRLKVEDLEKYSDPAKLATMRAVKAAIDPNGIMNPGAVLRASS
ncbi:MAG: FAD-binding oxidoreductase [Pseudomonadota bacterium]